MASVGSLSHRKTSYQLIRPTSHEPKSLLVTDAPQFHQTLIPHLDSKTDVPRRDPGASKLSRRLLNWILRSGVQQKLFYLARFMCPCCHLCVWWSRLSQRCCQTGDSARHGRTRTSTTHLRRSEMQCQCLLGLPCTPQKEMCRSFPNSSCPSAR